METNYIYNLGFTASGIQSMIDAGLAEIVTVPKKYQFTTSTPAGVTIATTVTLDTPIIGAYLVHKGDQTDHFFDRLEHVPVADPNSSGLSIASYMNTSSGIYLYLYTSVYNGSLYITQRVNSNSSNWSLTLDTGLFICITDHGIVNISE